VSYSYTTDADQSKYKAHLPRAAGLDPAKSIAGERGEMLAAVGEGIQLRELHPPHLKHQQVSIQSQRCKGNQKLTFPSSLQLVLIDIDQGDEHWRDPRSSRRRDLRGTEAPSPSKITR